MALCLGALALSLVVGLAASLIFYRHAYLSTEEVRVEAANFRREKAWALKRLGDLEEALSRTERFAAKIESAVDKKPNNFTGKGPVEETDGLPSDLLSSPLGMNFSNSTWRLPFAKSLTQGLNLSIDDMLKRAEGVEERIHSVFAKQQDRMFFWASLPSLWPSRGFVTSEFGDRRGWGGRGRMHEGIDIAGPRGTPIVAPGDGLITYSGYYHGYGQMITIDHGNGISTLYGHCSAMYVADGQRVKRGMIIAAVGNTGSSTGPHLHYEVHVDGVPVNPMLYIMR